MVSAFFKKDRRKEELLKDKIDLNQWQYNILYANKVPSFDSLSLDEGDKQIIKAATDVFIDVIENLRRTVSIFYPPYLREDKSLWFVAAYPDVVDYYYPGPKRYSKSKSNQVDQIMGLMKKRAKEIELFEQEIFSGIESGDGPNAEVYFIALKNYYKRRKPLLLAQG